MSYSRGFEELEAQAAMGLTLGEYDALPGTADWVDLDNPTLSKCEVIAWYRLSRRIPALMAEAASKKARKR